MSENSDLYEKITIRETVDGQPTTPPPSAEAMVEAANDKKKKAAKTTAKKKNSPDPYIWGIYIMLLVISVVEIFSASSSEVSGTNVYGPLLRHGMFLVGGLAIVLWMQRTPYMIINKFAWAFAGISLILLVISSMMGVEINGASRAIRIA